MSWIREIEEDAASGELAELYAQLRERRGRVANILKVHSLRPYALAHHLDLYMGLLFGPGRLTRGQRELIAVVVSRANGCEYCVQHHREALARYLRDAEVLDAVCRDYHEASLEPSSRVLADYADKLTRSPSTMQAHDLQPLRDFGFSDEDILLCNLIVAYFNFVNRIAMGLGVTHSAEEVQGYKL